MKEIELNKQLPIVTMNFEEVKQSLVQTMEKYKGIIVTEDTLQDCKATQKELAGIRIKIDTYRKDVKKEMEVPIKAFEGQCKELIGLIENAEQPIKNGISVFDNKRREEKKDKALELIKEAIESHQLNGNYASKLTIVDKYLVLNGSVKAVKEDIEFRAKFLKQEQDREEQQRAERKAAIETALESANRNINKKLKLEDFERYISSNQPLSTILQAVNQRAQMIYEAENPPKVEPKEEIKEEIKLEVKTTPVIQPKPIEKAKEEIVYFVNLRTEGTREEIAALSKFLNDNGYKYKVIGKGRV
ncbi:DUF1351 domain-containing protein [Inconstantimicrobium mannanitabidum]|uniref:Uncharacterized protein n=1 Tax=Inconstantimicrobium mannanitabidum TaxID=1604901 RepID=A0ACB5R9B3_9CLOT|nr:DUF1351 domain-containing protein [Clostridium sp. TW13]GKX65615.1 hypothetical protein rsdtw13_08730 [Clostridium sp. TW13]